MDLEQLGALLADHRERAGMSKAELGRRAEISPDYVRLVEGAVPRSTGRPSVPSRRLLESWAAALHMSNRETRRLLELAGYHEDILPAGPFEGFAAATESLLSNTTDTRFERLVENGTLSSDEEKVVRLVGRAVMDLIATIIVDERSNHDSSDEGP